MGSCNDSAVWVPCVQQGQDERSVPGNTVAVQADMPFNGLTKFGTAFLSKFECSQLPHQVGPETGHTSSRFPIGSISLDILAKPLQGDNQWVILC